GKVGAAEVALVLLLPGIARQAALRRRFMDGVVQPAVPVGRHARGLGLAVVDHPALAPPAGDCALVLIVAIALIVAADQLAAHFGEQPSAQRHPTALSTNVAPLVRARSVTGNATRQRLRSVSFVVMRFARFGALLRIGII